MTAFVYVVMIDCDNVIHHEIEVESANIGIAVPK
jgi:hypothetical protein